MDDSSRCQYWIRRKSRRCAHRIAAGNSNGLCSEHTHEGTIAHRGICRRQRNVSKRYLLFVFHFLALEVSRRAAEDAKIDHECRQALSFIITTACSSICDGENDCGGAVRKRKAAHSRVSAPKRMANPFRYITVSYVRLARFLKSLG